jgi:hypothetical protein
MTFINLNILYRIDMNRRGLRKFWGVGFPIVGKVGEEEYPGFPLAFKGGADPVRFVEPVETKKIPILMIEETQIHKVGIIRGTVSGECPGVSLFYYSFYGWEDLAYMAYTGGVICGMFGGKQLFEQGRPSSGFLCIFF